MGAQRLINLIKKMQNYDQYEAKKIVLQAGDNQREYMADLTREQLNAGIKGDKTVILERYRPRTLKYKAIMGQQLHPPNLRDTGSSQDHIEAVKFNDYYEMQSGDVKEESLMTQYGEDILSMTDDNVIKVSNEMLDDELELTKKYFKL